MKRISLLTISILASISQLGAATIPYTNDFSGSGANTAFPNEATNAEWALNAGVYQNTYSNSAITPTTASISIPDAEGEPFTLETQFTVQQTGTINSNGATLGFGLFASSSSFSGTNPNSYYLADFLYGHSAGTDVGRLRILSLGDAAGFTSSTGFADANTGTSLLAIVTGVTYTLRLEGTYVGSTLNMTFGLFDATGTTQIGSSATAADTSPLTGDFFGYRNRIGLGGGTSIIDFDNYSIVPEPSAVAMLLGGFGMLIGFQRSRRQK